MHLNIPLGKVPDVDSILEARLTEGLEALAAPAPVPEPIPEVYVSGQWVTSSVARCWNCTYTFDAVPCFIPINIRIDERGHLHALVHGNFCSFPCAVRYTRGMSQRIQRLDALNLLYRDMLHRIPIRIPEAPHYTEHRDYGGRLTDEKFREAMEAARPVDNPMSTGIQESAGTSVWDLVEAPESITVPIIDMTWVMQYAGFE